MSGLFCEDSEPKRPASPVHRVIQLYCELFAKVFHGERPAITPVDGKALKDLIAEFGEEKVCERLPLYVGLEDAYLEKNGYPLRLLRGTWNRLTALVHRPHESESAVRNTNDYLRKLRGQ